jgi:hypothetical protein
MPVFSSATPNRTANCKVLSQMAAHLRTSRAQEAGEIARFEPGIAGLQSGVTTKEPQLLLQGTTIPMSHNYPRRATTPDEPPLLPIASTTLKEPPLLLSLLFALSK